MKFYDLRPLDHTSFPHLEATCPKSRENETFQADQFISESSIKKSIYECIPNAYVSEGGFESSAPGFVRDQEWNHLDQWHRETIHNAYWGAMKIASGKDFAFTVTRWKNLPIFLPVFDIRLHHNLYYQLYNLFGIFYVHQISKTREIDNRTVLSVKWYIGSFKWLKPMHSLINYMVTNFVHKKQYVEDYPVRERRYELRNRGINFKTDNPDYQNSNKLDHQVILNPNPEIEKKHYYKNETDLSWIKDTSIHQVMVGPVELLVQKDVEMKGFKVWPGLCPHEGAKMEPQHLCKGLVQCPWHRLKFTHTLLNHENAKYDFLQATIYYDHETQLLTYKGPSNGTHH